MSQIACTAALGLLCLTSRPGELRQSQSGFSHDEQFVAADFQISRTTIDVFDPYDVSAMPEICVRGRCLHFQAHRSKCSLIFRVIIATMPRRGMINESYEVSASSTAGLRRALSETFVTAGWTQGSRVSLASISPALSDLGPDCR